MKIEIKQLSRIGSPKWVQACMKHTVQPICFADPWGKDDYSLNDLEENYCWETIFHECFHISAQFRVYY